MKVKVNIQAVETASWNFDTEIEVPDNATEEEIEEIINDRAYNIIPDYHPRHREFEEVNTKRITNP